MFKCLFIFCDFLHSSGEHIFGSIPTVFASNDVRKNERKTNKRKKKNTVAQDDLADRKDYASLNSEAEDRSMWRIRQ